ncbi:MAG: molecular chaperone DnaJ [Hyphomicrobium sp.]|nr:molecular chaperone DnaJ [Hyphomicrobium sp.]
MRSRAPLPSNFDILIDDLIRREDEMLSAPSSSRRFSMSGLEAAWDFAAARAGAAARLTQPNPKHYGDDGGSEIEPDASLDPNKILLELGLGSGVPEADVASLRREFALRNHPDRVPAELRALATQRMMIANDLIDRYVAGLRKSRG